MKKNLVKQVVGVDVAQKELVVSLGRMFDDWTPEVYARKAFANNARGFASLVIWVKKLTVEGVDLRFVMEATGVYHESLAYFLDANSYQVSVVLPNKISNYVRTLERKTITDQTAAEAITLFGLERKLTSWNRPKAIFRRLRQLTREREQVVELRTMAKNHLHAEQVEAFPNKESVARIKKQIVFLNKQAAEIKAEIQALSEQDLALRQSLEKVCSIPGVGLLTAVTVLAETNGFELIRNKRQLTSYAGLDIREKQSGTSVKGKARISKRGNKSLRKAMHFPALSAIKCNERYKAIFARIVARNGIKMKAAVAVQRKMLELIYTIWKNGSEYDPEYLQKKESSEAALCTG